MVRGNGKGGFDQRHPLIGLPEAKILGPAEHTDPDLCIPLENADMDVGRALRRSFCQDLRKVDLPVQLQCDRLSGAPGLISIEVHVRGCA